MADEYTSSATGAGTGTGSAAATGSTTGTGSTGTTGTSSTYGTTGTTGTAGTTGTYGTGSTYGTTGATGTTSTTETAKEQAGNLKEKAAETGGHLLSEAKGEAAAVTSEARRQLNSLWSQARDEVSSQAQTQQTRLAGGLGTFSSQLSQMASAPNEQNMATDLVRGVSDKVGEIGQWLDMHSPDELLDEVRSFARRRPALFLTIAAGAGIVVGRLARGLKDAQSERETADRPVGYVTAAPTRTSVLPRTTTSTGAGTAEPYGAAAGSVGSPPRYAPDLSTPSAAPTRGWDQR